MPHLFILLITLFLTACTESLPKTITPNLSEAPKNEQTTLINEKETTIEGNYTLEQGLIAYSDTDMSINKKINRSELVIEKLDDNDFGFYYTTQVDEQYTGKYFGIFHYKDAKYYQKVIEDDLNVSILDNMQLIQEDNRLKLTVKTNHGKRIIIWKNSEKTTISKELEEAKQSYIKICKEKFERVQKG